MGLQGRGSLQASAPPPTRPPIRVGFCGVSCGASLAVCSLRFSRLVASYPLHRPALQRPQSESWGGVFKAAPAGPTASVVPRTWCSPGHPQRRIPVGRCPRVWVEACQFPTRSRLEARGVLAPAPPPPPTQGGPESSPWVSPRRCQVGVLPLLLDASVDPHLISGLVLFYPLGNIHLPPPPSPMSPWLFLVRSVVETASTCQQMGSSSSPGAAPRWLHILDPKPPFFEPPFPDLTHQAPHGSPPGRSCSSSLTGRPSGPQFCPYQTAPTSPEAAPWPPLGSASRLRGGGGVGGGAGDPGARVGRGHTSGLLPWHLW